MRSVAIKGVKEFEIKEINEPARDGHKVLIDVLKAGICGSDLHYWVSGNPAGLVMGHEFSGVVTDPGDRQDLKVGDRVTALPISPCGHCAACLTGNPQYCLETWNAAVGLSLDNPGALAPKTAVRSDMVMKLPDTVSDEEGAMVEPMAVGLHAVRLANIRVGDTVLVVGGGIIGLACAMFAKKEGASLVAVSETNPGRGQKAVDLKVADRWFDVTKEDASALMMQESNGGFDVVIECCGNGPAVTSALMHTQTGGTVVLVGVSLDAITVPLTIGVMHELKMLGAIAYTKEEFASCINLIANKEIDVLKFVDKKITLNDVQAAYEELTSGQTNTIKILVDPNK